MFAQRYHERATMNNAMYVLLNSSTVFRWLQKQDDDEVKSRMAAGTEWQAAGPQTAKLRDP